MAKPFTVTASWDVQARVYTSLSDIPGLVAEAETFEEFVDLVRALAPEVIAANLSRMHGPHKVRVKTRLDLAVGLMPEDCDREIARLLAAAGWIKTSCDKGCHEIWNYPVN